MGHFLEHLLPASASALLALDRRPPPRGRPGLGGRARHACDLRRLRRRRALQRVPQRALHLLLRAALAPRVVLRLRLARRVFEAAGLRRRRGDRPAHVGSRVLEGRSRVALAVRLAGDGSGARHRAQASDAAARRRIAGPAPSTTRCSPTSSCSSGSSSCARVEELESLAGVIPNGVAPPATLFFRPTAWAARPGWRSWLLPDGTPQRNSPGSPSTRPVPRAGTSTSSATTSTGVAYGSPRVVVPALAGGTQTGPFLARRGAAVSERAAGPIAVECFVPPPARRRRRRTLRSLRDQSWAHWTAMVVGNDAASTVSALGDARVDVLPVSGDAALTS